MTPANLLKVRYIVLALWPNTAYNVDDIIHLESSPLPNAMKKMCEDHPHLFRKLSWWEHRRPNDMPGYVKSGKDVFKAYKWFDEDVQVEPNADKPKRFMAFGAIPIDTCLPATEEEFLNQQKKK